MKWIIITTLIFLLASCSLEHNASSKNALFTEVLTASKNDDSKGLSDSDYDKIGELIAQGETRWIRLYPVLSKSPFLGMTSFQESLNIVMAYALPKNPNEVLKFVDEENIDHICAAPFIEPGRDELRDYFDETFPTLHKALPEGYWKQSCLLKLRKALADTLPSIKES
ncbi:hypothetical protein [Pantoea sp. JZ2]|uniref:hypothetical protein n=1 Tax=Pantoea sp. JZ2 TaxID=2654189 RepID=UPI002B45D399|nr:hypothetical protein [Pantoea sp. JZ2]